MSNIDFVDEQLDLDRLPRHVGIIMDGSRRWAKKNGLTFDTGYEESFRRTIDIIFFASQLRIKYLSLFTFSIENNNRSAQEIYFLMSLCSKGILKYSKGMQDNNIRLFVSGRLDKIESTLYALLKRNISQSSKNTGLFVNLAFHYGGKQEILDAVNKASQSLEKNISEEEFRKFLYLPDFPDIDLIIRTSGEKRLSNFYLFQSAYSELYFSDVSWPSFTTENFVSALVDFQLRDRRFGEK